ncbi:RDD family protein [Streptomyces sp. M10]|uniref:RDD family protein n=1 Tax=Streptomyces sp. M10 TaxID=412968 RepID=UPI000645B76A|nr:RDD family protein [Streptomyces sp. M10]
MSGPVTGEAVALELRPAKLLSRGAAVLIDLVVTWLVFLLVMVGVLVSTGSLDEAAVAAVSVAVFLLVPVGGPIAVETLSHGRSLGKWACGLRVVREDGGPVRFRHALVRGAMAVVEILLTVGVVACVASLVSERGRRVGDVFAGTLVVRERIPVARVPELAAPEPWLAQQVNGLDLSSVPDSLWLAVRQYLGRARQLDAQVAAAMAGRLAEELAVRTGVPVPAGVPAGSYLAAVAYERRERERRKAEAVPLSGADAEVPGGWAGAVPEARDVGEEVSPPEGGGGGEGRSGGQAGTGFVPPV